MKAVAPMRVAMFPGLGAAYPDMVGKFLAAHPQERERMQAWLGGVSSREDDMAADLRLQRETHALNLQWWRQQRGELGPVMVCGHSLGYYAALVAAGVMCEEDSFELLEAVLRTVWPAFAGNQDVVCVLSTRSAQDIPAIADAHGMELLAENNAMQCVLYGAPAAWVRLQAALGDEVLRGVQLGTRVPFHSRDVARLAPQLAAAVKPFYARAAEPMRPLWSHISGEPIVSAEDALDLVASQPYQAVRWARMVERLVQRGAEEFVEVGPNRVLSQIVRWSAPSVTTRFVDTLRR